jgi:hypothetical protein
VDILFDIDIIKANKTTNTKIRPTNDEVVFSEEYIFKKYQIDSSQLSQSNIYYTSKFDLNLKIFNQVLERLEAEKELLIENKDSLELKIESAKSEKIRPVKKDTITIKKDSI